MVSGDWIEGKQAGRQCNPGTVVVLMHDAKEIVH